MCGYLTYANLHNCSTQAQTPAQLSLNSCIFTAVKLSHSSDPVSKTELS